MTATITAPTAETELVEHLEVSAGVLRLRAKMKRQQAALRKLLETLPGIPSGLGLEDQQTWFAGRVALLGRYQRMLEEDPDVVVSASSLAMRSSWVRGSIREMHRLRGDVACLPAKMR